MERSLIVNADDFGLSAGVNRGIIEAHERGIVTSASLMVRWPHAQSAASYAQSHPRLSVGLHLDLAEWVYRNDEWEPLYQVVQEDDATAVSDEVWRQVDTFRQLMKKDPDHLDSHQHVHCQEPARTIALEVAARLKIPLRHFNSKIQYNGSFYGQTGKGEPYPQALLAESLIAVLRELPPGVSELACHPGYDDGLETSYRDERAHEVRTLTDPLVRQAIESFGIRLCDFRDFDQE